MIEFLAPILGEAVAFAIRCWECVQAGGRAVKRHLNKPIPSPKWRHHD